ncbi:MAG: tetratricopeptide repeat protein [Candidatus Thermoplasmatota archaeon]
MKLTICEKIMLHLLRYDKYQDQLEVPIETTQEGIANEVGVFQSLVSRVIKKSIKDELIFEKLAHIGDEVRRRKAYFLTSNGSYHAKNLHKNIENETIKVKDFDGEIKNMKVSEAIGYLEQKLNKEVFIMQLINIIKDDIADFNILGEKKEKKSVIEKIGVAIRTELFGREEEKEALKKIFDETLNSFGKTVLIEGEIGVGTSRLAYELADYAVSNGAKLLYGKCFHSNFPYPFLPFKEAIGEHVTLDVKEEEIKELPMGLIPVSTFEKVNVAPEIISIFSPDTELISTFSNYTEKYEKHGIGHARIFETITQIIIRLARKRPIFLLIEDIQWADRASLQLLIYLARNIKTSKVLICLTHNPEYHEEKAVVEAIKKIGELANKFILENFKLKETELFIKALLSRDDVPSAFIELVHKESDGNPFFIEEIVKTFKPEDIAVKEKKLEIPKTVKDIMLRQINKFESDVLEVLRFSSVIGTSFEFRILKECSSFEEKKLLDIIEKLIENKLIKEKEVEDRLFYFFTQPKVRELIYEDMTLGKKMYIHKKVAEAFEKFYPKEVNKIAEHFYIAKEPNGIKYILSAAEKSMSLYANDDAIRFYKCALSLMKEKNSTLLEKLGDLYMLTGEPKNAKIEYLEAKEYASEEKKRELLIKIGIADEKNFNFDDALEILKEAVKGCESANDSFNLCKAYNSLGALCRKMGKYEIAIDYLSKSLVLADRNKEEKEKAIAYQNFGNTCYVIGDFEEAIVCYGKALKFFIKTKELLGLSIMYNNIGACYANQGVWVKAIRNLKKSLNAKEKIGDIAGMATTISNMGSIYCNIGDLEKALKFYEKSLKTFEKIGDKDGIASAYGNIGTIYRDMGKLDEALAYYEKCIELRKKTSSEIGLIQAYNNIGELYVKKGENEKALEYWKKSIELRKKLDISGIDVFDSFASVGEVYLIEDFY